MSDLIIYGFKYDNGGRIGSFTLQINPINIKITAGLENLKDDDKDASGNARSKPSQKRQPQTIDMKFTIDKTGVVNKQINRKNLSSVSIAEEINNLRNVCVHPNWHTHKNPFVALQWGDTFRNIFYGQTTSFNYNYTFFAKDGSPLRAEVHMKIKEGEGWKLNRNFQSPDITKTPLIKDKDTLVKVSIDNYDDKNYYLRIAEYNNLVSIRDMKNGNKIILPPLRK